MVEILSAAGMRAREAAAIAGGAVTGLALMERAGAEVVAAIFEVWPELGPDLARDPAAEPRRAAVLCGPGNNGGDGFVVARLLHDLGWRVEVFLLGDPARLPPDARRNHDLWAARGPVRPYLDAGAAGAFALDPALWREDSLLVDALFGIGLTRPLRAGLAAARLSRDTEFRLPQGAPRGQVAGCRVVAVDIPSGLCADTGRVLRAPDLPTDWAPFTADLTVTFHAPKIGHLTAEGPAHCGRLVVRPIGL
ncbi:NAD(P)H-hydrate epimerase [Phaeovulum vinaykumarii]|uniref:NAD(P)H-hydrate epimerase n=1 Tax=Phaeovulum vinaykumarii TaxID=407234 RepID=A0A1N7L709_9RHOB|nr:NAD(P)H-hydrate epimerase [Phaeovulum vinaykumarii]SIS69597.1 yjeF N-terminal region [Phaeovulum vinaykumarii]SOB99412.1 hydroxyethylthiazole kinase-like uncharacterized protein yjeF [Phaeovulum vinaykumarii]